MTFKELNLNAELIEALSYMNFKDATPIQEQAIPKIIEGRDILGVAQTGTGKTAAFVLPILHKLAENPSDFTDTLVVCPTRELAMQIEQAIQGLSYFVAASSIPLYGGGDGKEFSRQKVALDEGCNIVIATPGKLISHLNLGSGDFSKVKHLILDEADRMLDMGFQDDILKIISYLPKKRQNLLFSATMPPKIIEFSKKLLENPHEISIAISKPSENIQQGAYLCYDNQKAPLIKRIIDAKKEYKSIIVFSSTIRNVSKIVTALKNKEYQVAGISSELEQKEREEMLQKFRAKKIKVVVATDVLSRGIDIKDIDLVINYDVPNDGEDYVHRIGRTARAATKGVAITLINEDDMYKFNQIEELIEKKVRKLSLPTELGEGPEWKVGGKKKFHPKKGKNFKKR